MVLVDVYVPVINQIYDFYLDSHKPVRQLIAEISGLIAEKEDTGLFGTEAEFWLCEMLGGIVLSKEHSLSEQGIEEGAGLLLV